jgi:hypothetical protein
LAKREDLWMVSRGFGVGGVSLHFVRVVELALGTRRVEGIGYEDVN